MVPLWLIEAGVSPRAIQVFALIAAKFADRDTGAAMVGRAEIAKAVGVADKHTIDAAIDELAAAQAMTREHRTDPVTGYKIPNEYVVYFSRPSTRQAPAPEGDPLPTQTETPRQKNPPRAKVRKIHLPPRRTSTPTEIQSTDHQKEHVRAEFTLTPETTDEKPEAESGPTTKDALAAFYQAWETLYGVKPDRSPSNAGKMKHAVEERGADDVLLAVARYFATTDDFVRERKHPLGLFVTQIGRLVAEANTAAAVAARHEASRQQLLDERQARDARARQVRIDAVAAIKVMPEAARFALQRMTEAAIADALEPYPEMPAAARAAMTSPAAIAERMVEQLINLARGRTMAETADAYAADVARGTSETQHATEVA
jgi:hypothetical protein